MVPFAWSYIVGLSAGKNTSNYFRPKCGFFTNRPPSIHFRKWLCNRSEIMYSVWIYMCGRGGRHNAWLPAGLGSFLQSYRFCSTEGGERALDLCKILITLPPQLYDTLCNGRKDRFFTVTVSYYYCLLTYLSLHDAPSHHIRSIDMSVWMGPFIFCWCPFII